MTTKTETRVGHTPGPWQVAWYPRQQTAEIETVEQESGKYRHLTNNMPMCAGPHNDEVEMIVDEDDPERRAYRYSAEACANARLIAAAPEMLEALEAVIECGSLDPNGLHKFGREYQMVLAAIACAKGEQP
jgi:hypothetical protein